MIYETDLAYAAGIIDGEGSIQISKTKGRHGEINPCYELIVKVANTDIRMLEWLEFHFGGKFASSRRGNDAERNTCYNWYLLADNAMLFLTSIRRYLSCKKAEVDIALALRETYRNKRKCCRYGTPQEIVLLRDRYYYQLKNLHHHKGNG